MEEEPQGDPFGKSYRSTTPTTAYAINPLMLGASHVQEMFGHQYYRTNRPQLTDGPPGSNVKNTWNTTGMSCMLCQHALVMNFSRKNWFDAGYIEQLCQGGNTDEEALCPETASPCNQKLLYTYEDRARVKEESISVLYVHWKDYWHFEPAVVGVPYTWWDEGRPPSATPSQSYYSDDFGNRRFGFPPTPSDPPNACASTIPHPTDGNYMCFPELKRVTNPLNPYFYRNNLKDIHGDTIGGGSDFQAHLKSAHYSHDARVLDEGDIYEPELMNIRSGCRSNHNPINPLSNGGAGGGLSARGFSSWQCYMMQHNRELRTLADIATFGDGAKLFSAPQVDGIEGAVSDLYTTTVGTLYRARLWVRADKFYLQTGEDKFAYPCTTGFGEEGTQDTELGSCCITWGNCLENITRSTCDLGYDGTWIPNNWCGIESDVQVGTDPAGYPIYGGEGTDCCRGEGGSGDPPVPGNIYELNEHFFGEEDSNQMSCCARTVEGWTNTAGGVIDNACDFLGYGATFECGGSNPIAVGPNQLGEITAFHPPLVNERMRRSTFAGGYTPCQKQHGGPWGMIYMCAGVPVFSYEIDELVEDESIDFSPGDRSTLSTYWNNGPYPDDGLGNNDGQEKVRFECGTLGAAVQRLGDTGRFNAKDWREDQLIKYDTLEEEFARIYSENPDSVPREFSEYQVPSAIRSYITPNFGESDPLDPIDNYGPGAELLPVQKTNRFMLSAFINQSIGKEKIRRGEGQSSDPTGLITEGAQYEYKLSGEMSHYQITAPVEGIPESIDEVRSYDRGFFIDRIDPWHEEYSNLTNTGVKLGSDRPSIPIDFSWGTFNFRYPIQEMYDVAGIDVEIPEWEKEMFEAWYTNIPIYFHATPGGWSWSGTGWGPTPRNRACNWGNGAGGNWNLSRLENLYQINMNTLTGGNGASALACGFGPEAEEYTSQCCDCSDDGGCMIPPYPPFPNNIRLYSDVDSGYSEPSMELQPRDLPSRVRCNTLPAQCAGCSSPFSQNRLCPDELGEGVNTCCQDAYQGCVLNIDGPVYPNCEDENAVNYVSGCIVPRVTPYNCCKEFDPYDRQNPFKRATAYIKQSRNKQVIEAKSASPYELQEFVTTNYPNNASIVGTIGSELRSSSGDNICSQPIEPCGSVGGGNCSELQGCICCYGDASCSDNDTFCNTPELCEFPPCSDENPDGPCCDYDGVCCFNWESNNPSCQDDVSSVACCGEDGSLCDPGGPNKWEAQAFSCETAECGLPPKVFGACCECEWRDGQGPGSDGWVDGDDEQCQTYERPDDRIIYTCGDDFSEQTCLKGVGIGNDATFYPNTDCADLEPPCTNPEDGPDGSCCNNNITEGMPDPDCYNTWQENCPSKTHVWTEGGSCADCLAETYTCCLGVGQCTQVNRPEDCDGVLISAPCPDENPDVPQINPCTEGLFSHCCFPDGSCENFTTERECIEDGGNYIRGRLCSGNSCEPGDPDEGCGGLGPKLTGCQPLIPGFGGVATRWAPLSDAPCAMRAHDALDTCALWHYQASSAAFRVVVYSTLNKYSSQGGSCPARFGAETNPIWGCCCPQCSGYHTTRGICSNASETVSGAFHERAQEFTVTVYPYKIRCSQITDINGFQRCGLLQELIAIDDDEYINRLPRVLVGRVDPMSCHVFSYTVGGGGISESEVCTYANEGCPVKEKGQPNSCDDATAINTSVIRCADDDCTFGTIRAIRSGRTLNHGGYCMNLQRDATFNALSYRFDPLIGDIGQRVYTPFDPNENYAISGIPQFICPSRGAQNTTELPSPDKIPEGSVLDKCADYWNDKEASKMDLNDTLHLPPTETGIVFKHYDGVDSSTDFGTLAGVSAEYVDNDTDDALWPNFWMKRKYPSLEKIRLFGVGNFQVDDRLGTGWGGGKVPDLEPPPVSLRGQFAGTMVPIFASEQDTINFDNEIGNKNLSMTIGTEGIPGQPDDGENNKMANCRFVARPSRNPFWTDCVPADDPTCPEEFGWLCGAGITYANVKTGTGPMLGKVYEFCSGVPEASPNPGNCGLKGVNPPSGFRGPVGFKSREPFVVNIERMIGFTNANLYNCRQTDANCL